MAKEIETTRGYKALVDDIDFEFLSQFHWRYHRGYAVRGKYDKATEKRLWIGMHQTVLERKLGHKPTKGQECDHRDCNRLNNTRNNLRLATHSQNMANIPKRLGKSSRFRGVSWYKRLGKWQTLIRINGKQVHIGLFNDEEAAARVYDQQALLVFGEFACLNFPPQ